jgi:hypothetical protein
MLALLVHRLHHSTYDPGEDRTPARAAYRIAEKAAQCPARSRIGTRSAAKERTKERTSSDTADRTANDLGQLAHRYLLQDRTDSLTAENAGNNLNNDRKNCFHVEVPPKLPVHSHPGRQYSGPTNAISQAQRRNVHRSTTGPSSRGELISREFLEHAARKQGRVLGAGSAPLAAGITELILGLVPSLSINAGFMLSFAAAIPLQDATDRSEDTVE